MITYDWIQDGDPQISSSKLTAEGQFYLLGVNYFCRSYRETEHMYTDFFTFCVKYGQIFITTAALE